MAEDRQAAALILWTRNPEFRIFVVRRAEHMRAFPGNWSFPGGGLEAQDYQSLPAQDTALPEAAARQAALREVFEETGLLRSKPSLEELVSLGLRVSPPIVPRRFVTHYFALEMPEPRSVVALSEELEAADWFRPAVLLQRWEKGEILIPPPVLEVLRVLHAADSLDESEIKALRAQANSLDQIFGHIEVHPGIEMLPLRTPTLPPATHTNCYFVGRERFVVIDPAPPEVAEQQVLKERLEARLNQGHRPEAILLTHHHRDHIGAVEFLRTWLQIPVLAHPLSAERLQGKLKIDREIEDGFVLDLGTDAVTGGAWLLQAIFTPGHAPGHLCFVDQRHRVAVVGDMLAGVGTILIKRPRGHMQDYLDSLARLADLNLHLALPAHGPMITRPRRRCEEYIEHRLQRERQILAALQAGTCSESELLAWVYADIDPRAEILARWSLEAHLHKLCSEGRVQHSEQQYTLV